MTVQIPNERGRKKIHSSTLRPDGLTPEQHSILVSLSKENALSTATLRREAVRMFLESFGYSSAEQGLTRYG